MFTNLIKTTKSHCRGKSKARFSEASLLERSLVESSRAQITVDLEPSEQLLLFTYPTGSLLLEVSHSTSPTRSPLLEVSFS